MQRPARHPLAADRLQQAPFAHRDHACHGDEGQEEWHADDEHGQARRNRQPDHDEHEIDNARDQGQQHVEKGKIRTGIEEHPEERARQAGGRRGARHGGLQRRFDFCLRVPVSRRYFVRGTVGTGDEFQDIRFGLIRVRRDLGAQVLLCVVRRVLDQSGILASQRLAQALQIVGNGAGGRATHEETPEVKWSTKSRVCCQIRLQSRSTRRPSSVIR